MHNRGGKRLRRRWGTIVMDLPQHSLTAAMVSCLLRAMCLFPFLPSPLMCDTDDSPRLLALTHDHPLYFRRTTVTLDLIHLF